MIELWKEKKKGGEAFIGDRFIFKLLKGIIIAVRVRWWPSLESHEEGKRADDAFLFPCTGIRMMGSCIVGKAAPLPLRTGQHNYTGALRDSRYQAGTGVPRPPGAGSNRQTDHD